MNGVEDCAPLTEPPDPMTSTEESSSATTAAAAAAAPSRITTIRPSDEWPPWSRFKEWIHAICVVTFDLELGQALEVMYPGDAQLTSAEKTNICYLAFPDSNSGNNRDTKYHFRIRRSCGDLTTHQADLLAASPSSLPFDSYFLYGFVHFRQQREPNLPRGYYQKSVVLISLLPFVQFFAPIVEKIALGYFDIGEPAIEAACHDIDQWSAPVAGDCVRLPLMGVIIECRIPASADAPLAAHLHHSSSAFQAHPRVPGDSDVIFLRSLYEPDLYRNLSTVVKHIQLLWELVLIGEPILVIASGPTRSASIVQSLIALIAPLKYGNDYRPYFTIHDSEFREYTGKSKSPTRVLLGVTNPFFVKALEHWPHILKVAEKCHDPADSADTKQEKARKHWDGRILDAKPGLFTQYKPFLAKDDSLVKKISKSDRPDDAHSSVLQRHLLELTQSFMIPLERYLSSLMPLRKQMSPFKSVPSARAFNIEEFLATLDDAGPSLTCGVKGDWPGLYKKFIHSPSFACWLSTRSTSMARQLKMAYVEALCEADLGRGVLSQRHHVEIVDLVLRIRQRLTELDAASERRTALARQVRNILDAVDDELKSVLMSNCALRDIVA